jgi:hypothetical protein
MVTSAQITLLVDETERHVVVHDCGDPSNGGKNLYSFLEELTAETWMQLHHNMQKVTW